MIQPEIDGWWEANGVDPNAYDWDTLNAIISGIVEEGNTLREALIASREKWDERDHQILKIARGDLENCIVVAMYDVCGAFFMDQMMDEGADIMDALDNFESYPKTIYDLPFDRISPGALKIGIANRIEEYCRLYPNVGMRATDRPEAAAMKRMRSTLNMMYEVSQLMDDKEIRRRMWAIYWEVQ